MCRPIERVRGCELDAELVEYLAQHDGEPETTKKLHWLLAKSVRVFGERRISSLRSPEIACGVVNAIRLELTGSFGAGLTRFLTGRGERVLEVSRLRREPRDRGVASRLACRLALAAVST